jgi:hypothetical protein
MHEVLDWSLGRQPVSDIFYCPFKAESGGRGSAGFGYRIIVKGMSIHFFKPSLSVEMIGAVDFRKMESSLHFRYSMMEPPPIRIQPNDREGSLIAVCSSGIIKFLACG